MSGNDQRIRFAAQSLYDNINNTMQYQYPPYSRPGYQHPMDMRKLIVFKLIFFNILRKCNF